MDTPVFWMVAALFGYLCGIISLLLRSLINHLSNISKVGEEIVRRLSAIEQTIPFWRAGWSAIDPAASEKMLRALRPGGPAGEASDNQQGKEVQP